MRVSVTARRLGPGLALALLAGVAAGPAQAQSTGKWVARITQLNGGGAADLTVESRNDRQSRAKITFQNTRGDTQLGWDIVAGSCRDEGAPIAPVAAFNQVTTQMDGGGSATANVPKLEAGKKYYVRIFNPKSAPTDASAYGCANLSEVG